MEVVLDWHALGLANGQTNLEVLPTMIVDEVYEFLSETDTEDMDDYAPLTYDPEDEEHGEAR